MASSMVIVDKDASCANDPDFAVICAFLEKFSEQLQVNFPHFKQLQEWLSNTDEVPNGLRDLHIKLMRKTRRTVHECAWESALSKFCFCYSSQDGWEIERFGYKKSSLKVKLRILRELLENQFDRNNKFRAKILAMTAESLRSEPIGRDRLGHSYWMTQDAECNIRIYQEHLDEEIWQVVATNREELVKLISRLKGNEVVLPSDIGFIDEDSSSNSCSVPIEKPPPPEEKDDSQESNQSISGRVPNIKIKLGNKDNGNIATVSNESEEVAAACGNDGEMEEEEKKVKPLVISQSKIKLEFSKKRSLDECEKIEAQEVKKQRPTLLDSNREKKLGRYEKQKDDEEEDDHDGEEDEDGEEEADDEEEDDENSADEGEEEEDDDETEAEKDDEDDDEDDDEEEEQEEKKEINGDKLGDKIEESSEPTQKIQKLSKNFEENKNEDSTKDDEVMKTSAKKEVPKKEEVVIPKTEDVEQGDKSMVDGKSEEPTEDHKSMEVEDKSEKEEDKSEKEEEKSEKEGETPRNVEEEVEGNTIKLKIETKDEDVGKTFDDAGKEETKTEVKKAAVEEKIGDKPQTQDIETLSEDVEMEELKYSEEEERNSAEEAEVSEAIEDPTVIVKGEGSGAECENIFDSFLFYNQPNDEEEAPEFSEEIEDTIIFIQGEGSGAECLVGNAKASETETKATFFFGQPGCLKLSPVKNQSKSDDSENDCNDNTTDKPEEIVKKIAEPTNGENHSSEPEAVKKTPKVPSMEKKRNKPESKNGNQEERRPTRRTLINRKRRLSDEKPEKPAARPSSESETDLNSENLEDPIPDEQEDEDIGGKRLKMRSKLVNTEIRKKVEAQRKTATKEETTTSSSGGEEESPRKKVIVKKTEKEPEKAALTPKAKIKQKAKSSPAASKSNKVENKKVKIQEKIGEKPTEKPSAEEENKVDEVIEEQITKTQPSTTTRLINKQTKKPHPVESNNESDDEIPKKKQPQEQIASQSPTELIKVQKEKSPPTEVEKPKIVEAKKATTPEASVEEEQSATSSDKQRKRRSSEDDTKETSPVSPPVVVKTTRSSRRSGPPEPAIELPQVKRTRVKAAAAAVKADVKAEVKTEVKTEVKSEVKPDAKSQQVPKEDESKKNSSKTPIKKDQVKEKKEKEEVVQVKEEAKVKEEPVVKTPIVLPRPRQQQAAQKQPATSTGQRRKCHDDVDTKNIIDLDADGTPVRMSRRIAQLKIREEADRRKMEEIALRNMKAELKKKKKAESKPEDPVVVSEPSEHSSDQADSEVEVKKKAEKKKKIPGKDGWSSGSEELDEEEVEEHRYEVDHGSPLFKSDHEFSPESDLEDDSQVVPLKRARTARKEGEEDNLEAPRLDESCQKCSKSDHPEWILLCDKCNKGYHCSCLSPVIFYIPEGDWFCPPCQQEVLIVALENHLKEFDDLVQRKKDEEEEKIRVEQEQRLELEKASQVKVEKKSSKKEAKKQRTSAKKVKSSGASSKSKKNKNKSDDDCSDGETETEGSSNSSNSSSSGSGSSKSKSSSATDTDDEPIYKLRKRRQINVSYRLNEYDEIIAKALKKEEDALAGAGNLGRGKDISNAYDDIEESPLAEPKVEENGGVEKPSSGKTAPAEDSGSDFEPINRKPKTGRNGKKKHRKLTKLDISSEGDNDSDEDFKTSSMDDDEEDEDEEEVSQSSDSSLDVYRRRRGSRKGKKKKSKRSARRSARERRKDRKFIVDDSDCDGSEAEVRRRTKKKRKKDSDYTESETNDEDDELSENINSEDLCDDSTDGEVSDGAWCPSKRKKQRSNAIARKSPKLKPKMGTKAKKTKRYDSDSGSFKASVSKNRVIRDESDDDDDNDDSEDDSVDSSRKTRGKRCLYLEDFDDDSSDGGIKPGVKRPDTPPEEREKFIKKQEEIKRMLAEKNAEGAKLAATPRLIPIKSGVQRSPAKLDSLSTVPLAVIRQAKVLDIDYLQRKGESISEGDLDESEFDDDDLPDDFNPEDMDEEAIARMVEEDFAQQQQLKLPLPSEVLRKKSTKESEPIVRPISTYMPPHMAQPQQSSSTSGLQEPVRKKLPMPTIHPPLLRHGYGPPMMQQSRQQHLPLLQNALSAPLNHPMSRQYPPTSQAIPATNQGLQQQGGMSSGVGGGDPNKPRGRRKKITPLRDPLQKQQAAAAASAAAAAASKPRPDNVAEMEKPEARHQPQPPPAIVQSATPGVIKSALSIAQPPQLYKPAAANTQPSVITRMPHLQARPMMHMGGGPGGGGPPFPDQGPRFYRPQHPQSHLRPQAQHQQQQQRPPPPQHHQRPPPPQHQQRPPPPQHQQQRPPPPQHQPQQQRQPPPQQSQPQQHRQQPPNSQSQPPSQQNSLIPGNRPPMRHRGTPQMPPMTSHHSMRPSFVGGPPPLRPSSGGGPPPPISLGNNIARDQGPPRQSSPYSGPEQYAGPPPPSRHSAPPPPPHLSPYRPQMFNTPGFPHRGPPVNSSQPSLIRPVGAPPPEYSSPGSFGGGYGYYPPPLSVPHSAPPPPTASAVPSSVIVSASSLGATTSVVVAPSSQPVPTIQPPSRPPVASPSLLEKPCAPAPVAAAAPLPPSSSTTIPTSVIELSRKKLTTLETFNTSKNSTPPPLRESSESRSPYSSNPPTIGGPDDAPDDGSGSPPTSSQSTSEFSGLVSYFSSQHDDLNT